MHVHVCVCTPPSPGDKVLGYDVANMQLVGMDYEAFVNKGGRTPDVVLVSCGEGGQEGKQAYVKVACRPYSKCLVHDTGSCMCCYSLSSVGRLYYSLLRGAHARPATASERRACYCRCRCARATTRSGSGALPAARGGCGS